MSTEKMLSDLEKTIKKVNSDIRKKNGAVGSDKLDSLSKLVNSYTRLMELNNENKSDPYEDGEPGFYEEMCRRELEGQRRRHVAKKNRV